MKKQLIAALLFAATLGAFAKPKATEKRMVIPEDYLTFKANDDFTEVTITGFKKNGTDFSGKVVELPSKIQGVPVTSISSCHISGIAGLVIPEGVKSIGYAAFKYDSIGSVQLPETLESIESNAFQETGLKSINLPANLKVIGSGAFWYCKNLESIDIPKNCKIEAHAFYESGIKKLKLPAGRVLFSYGEYINTPFLCANLEKFEIPEDFAPIYEDDGLHNDEEKNITLANFIGGEKISASFALQKQLKAVKVLSSNNVYQEERNAAVTAYNAALEKEDFDESKKVAEQFIAEHSFFPNFTKEWRTPGHDVYQPDSSNWYEKITAIEKLKANSNEYSIAVNAGKYAEAAKLACYFAKNSNTETERAVWEKRANNSLVTTYNTVFEAKNYEAALQVANDGYNWISSYYNDYSDSGREKRDEWRKRKNDVLIAEYNMAFETKDYKTALQIAEDGYDNGNDRDEWNNRKWAVLDVYVVEPFMRDLESKGEVQSKGLFVISIKDYYNYNYGNSTFTISYGSGNKVSIDSDRFVKQLNKLTGSEYKIVEGGNWSNNYKLVRPATEKEKAEFAKKQEVEKKARNDAKILKAFNSGDLRTNIRYYYAIETKHDKEGEIISKIDKDSVFYNRINPDRGLQKKDIIKEITFTGAEGNTKNVKRTEFDKLMAPGTLTFTVLRGKKKEQKEIKIDISVEWNSYELEKLKLE